MTLNDLDLATICAALYADQPDGYWAALWPHDGGYAALRRLKGVDVVVWRGSETFADWMQDLTADPVTDPKLGMVHGGFWRGVQSVHDVIAAAIKQPFYVVGHSLGAAHSLIDACLLKNAGRQLLGVTTFGSPCPGGIGLSHVLWNVAGHDYRNRSDGVTDVPQGLGYMHPRTLTSVDVAPALGADFGPLADHHMALYHTAMQAMFQPTDGAHEP
jgi:hypothetical protein